MPTLPPAASGRSSHRAPGAAAVGLLLLTVTVLIASPAAAHPFVRGGGEVPVDSSVTIILDLAHGCGSEADGTGQDTLEVALEVPSWLRVLAVAEHPAYRHDLEVTGGRIAVVTWNAVGTAEPAPAFEVDVVATGTAGQARHLGVFQGCADRSHRWIGTPEAPAEDPAVNLRLTAADPARPAPPEPPTEQAPPAPDDGADADPAGDGSPGSGAGGSGPGLADLDAADPDATSDQDGATAEETTPLVAGVQGDQGTGGDDGDGWPVGLGGSGLLVAVIVAGLVVLAWSRRGRGDRAPRMPS